jgi:ATP-dependent exoDNAse (exonuclease V) beta subunit
MTLPTNLRQHAQELITQIPGSSLPQVVAILEELCRSVDPTPQTLPEQKQEQALLHKIQQKLAPEEQTRLAYLRQQNEREVITASEHQELLTYIDRIEQQDAERAEALIQLAQIRKVDLKSLMAQYLPVSNAV